MNENYFNLYENISNIEVNQVNEPVLTPPETFVKTIIQNDLSIIDFTESLCSIAKDKKTILKETFYTIFNQQIITNLIDGLTLSIHGYRNSNMFSQDELLSTMELTYNEYIENKKMTDGHCNILSPNEIQTHILELNGIVSKSMFSKNQEKFLAHLNYIKGQYETRPSSLPTPLVIDKSVKQPLGAIPPRK